MCNSGYFYILYIFYRYINFHNFMIVSDEFHDIGLARLLIIQGSFSFGLGDLNPVDLSAKVSNTNQMVKLVKSNKSGQCCLYCSIFV